MHAIPFDANGASAFELAPPLPPRPLQWRRAWQLLRSLVRDPEATERVFELFEAVGGRGDERTVQAFAAHPEGARLFREQPRLLARLADREGLAALPEGSLGRAYLAFAQRNGFAADGLLEANQRGLGAQNARLDPDRRWFFERVNLIHDLWHVLTGYDTDPAGESALLAFSAGQGLASRSIWLLIGASLAMGPKRPGFAYQRFVVQAYRRGRRAGPLFVQRYEDLLAWPLPEVRAMLRIQSTRDAHPNGGFRSGKAPWDAERVPA
jgi:ubiquinone biosynthesis protein COQ4